MLHFRSKREIEDLPVRLVNTGTPGIGIANRLGNMRGLLGAVDVGSCLNIARIKLDLWLHDWTNTSVSGGFPFGVTHTARFQATQTFERNQFAFLSPVFDWSVFANSFGDNPTKTYANEAARLADTTLTEQDIGSVFKQTNPVVTYWILKRLKTSTAEGVWEQLKEPLPRVKAAYVASMGGGVRYISSGGTTFPVILIVGTTYNFTTGKFEDTADSEFVTFFSVTTPTNGIFPETEPGVTSSFLGYSYDSLIAGTFFADPHWPDYDETPRRTFVGPSAGVHNDSWFIRAHSFPAFVYDFPLLDEDNSGNPYTYTEGTVNAGYEAIESQQSFNGSSNPGLTTGRHLDFKSAIKLDMGVLAQEDPNIYPPTDSNRYIRDLQPMK